MANEEVLGPRKTMFVLVIVVGCFAVLWPRILSPLLLGTAQDLQPNQFDREAALKQERQPNRGMAPHPALRERGRAIPPGAPTPPSRVPVPLPPHVRVRPSPLSGYFEIDVKPPPIPGMRPPLGSPGGPVQAPKSSMGFVMPIYTICIIVFFVYTLSKILFKRTGGPSVAYEPIPPDPHFRRRVFRGESKTTPERKLVVSAISGLVAEVQQQMEASYAQNQQRQDLQDNHTRPYTNGTVHSDHAQVRIIATEYKEPSTEQSSEIKETMSEPKDQISEPKEATLEPKKPSPDPIKSTQKPDTNQEAEMVLQVEEPKPEPKNKKEPEPQPSTSRETSEEPSPLFKIPTAYQRQFIDELQKLALANPDDDWFKNYLSESKEVSPEAEDLVEPEMYIFGKKEVNPRQEEYNKALLQAVKSNLRGVEEPEAEASAVKVVNMESTAHTSDGGTWPRDEPAISTPKKPAVAEDLPPPSIFLQTEIPQQSSVLVADCSPNIAAPQTNNNLVVSGKMTLSLIQDALRDTPERELESTMDDFTTASAMTEPAVAEQKEEQQKEDQDEELSEEEVEEEFEVEEIEEEVEEEEPEEKKI